MTSCTDIVQGQSGPSYSKNRLGISHVPHVSVLTQDLLIHDNGITASYCMQGLSNITEPGNNQQLEITSTTYKKVFIHQQKKSFLQKKGYKFTFHRRNTKWLINK